MKLDTVFLSRNSDGLLSGTVSFSNDALEIRVKLDKEKTEEIMGIVSTEFMKISQQLIQSSEGN
jgi:hypothetical protein